MGRRIVLAYGDYCEDYDYPGAAREPRSTIKPDWFGPENEMIAYINWRLDQLDAAKEKEWVETSTRNIGLLAETVACTPVPSRRRRGRPKATGLQKSKADVALAAYDVDRIFAIFQEDYGLKKRKAGWITAEGIAARRWDEPPHREVTEDAVLNRRKRPEFRRLNRAIGGQ